MNNTIESKNIKKRSREPNKKNIEKKSFKNIEYHIIKKRKVRKKTTIEQ